MPARRTRRGLSFLASAGVLLGVAHRRSRHRDDRHRRTIAALDPDRDHEAIVQRLGEYEFPWDTETALSLALFRTFAVPSISRVLASTGEFTERPRKRYDDTELLLAEVGEHGYDSPRGREAIRRINRMHAAYAIRPEDLAYVLSTFVLEPDRFNARYGWRRSTEHERAATWRYWRELGARMGVRELPDTLEGFDRWNRAFEAAEFRFDPANRAVAEATLEMYLRDVYGVPRWAMPAARPVALALLDDPVLEAVGFASPPRWLRLLVDRSLRGRALALRWFVPPRREPVRITARPRPTYPFGYRVGELGTFPAATASGRADGEASAPAGAGSPSGRSLP